MFGLGADPQIVTAADPLIIPHGWSIGCSVSGEIT
jgi:hypothetical protein